VAVSGLGLCLGLKGCDTEHTTNYATMHYFHHFASISLTQITPSFRAHAQPPTHNHPPTTHNNHPQPPSLPPSLLTFIPPQHSHPLLSLATQPYPKNPSQNRSYHCAQSSETVRKWEYAQHVITWQGDCSGKRLAVAHGIGSANIAMATE
jgi:hypothetical protein